MTTKLSRFSLGLVAAIGCLAPAAQAGPILFNPTGGGAAGAVSITSLGFGEGNVLAEGALNTPLAVGSTFTLLFQTHLTSLVGQNAVPGLNTSFQITEVGTLTETVSSIMTTSSGIQANFVLTPGGSDQINIYENNSVIFSDANGTGFTAGTLIASLNPTSVGTSEFTNSGTTGQYNSTGSGDNSGSGTAAVGTGNSTITSGVLATNSSYFVTQPLTSSMFLASLSTQASDVPPSMAFTNVITGATVTPNIGSVNGNSGPDIQFQSAGFSQSFATVPEPASIAMTVLGLAGVGVLAARRRAKASA